MDLWKASFLSHKELNILIMNIFIHHSSHIPLLRIFIKSFHGTDGENETWDYKTWLSKVTKEPTNKLTWTFLVLHSPSLTIPIESKEPYCGSATQRNSIALMPICRLAEVSYLDGLIRNLIITFAQSDRNCPHVFLNINFHWKKIHSVFIYTRIASIYNAVLWKGIIMSYPSGTAVCLSQGSFSSVFHREQKLLF